jgi:uncharacterized membrane-anchored protein
MAVSPPRVSKASRPIADAARSGEPATRSVEGAARLGRPTKRLTPRLAPGDVAVIDHRDLDRASAEDLLASGVGCVLNASASSTARYPNPGPLILAEAGVLLVDAPGLPLFELLGEGDRLALTGGRIERNGLLVGHGEVQDVARARENVELGRGRLADALSAFTANTMAHLPLEAHVLAGPLELPSLRTPVRERPALVVIRGADTRAELRALRSYVRDERPALLAVDGGADALLDEGLTPEVIVGDMDSATDAALASGAELVLHAYPDGRAPGRERLSALGLEHHIFHASGTSEDAATLLAAELGADLLVAVGSSFDLLDFLDRSRAGASSTFLTRLRTQERLVSARTVARLRRR